MVLENVHGVADAEGVARCVIEQIARPFTLGDGTEASVASVGISLFPSDGTEARSLVQKADAALYQAKFAGRGA